MRVVHLSTLHRALDVRIFYKECRTLAAAGHEVHFLVPEPPDRPREGRRIAVPLPPINPAVNHKAINYGPCVFPLAVDPLTSTDYQVPPLCRDAPLRC